MPAARIAVAAVASEAPHLRKVTRIRFVLHTPADLEVYARVLAELVPRAGDT